MRTTTRIDDVLLEELKEKARKENASLTNVVNRVLRSGLAASRTPSRRRRHRERTFSMGRPAQDLRKALALASRLEDAGVLEKLALRK
ncbi:MAG: hypothetical protein ACXVID_09000 [Thermoanaerobaculia bacterium]